MCEAVGGVEGQTGLQRVEEGKNRPAHRLHRALQKVLFLPRSEEQSGNEQVEVGEEEDVDVLGERSGGSVLRERATRRRR